MISLAITVHNVYMYMHAVEDYNYVYDITIKYLAIQLNFEQNIETSSKILTIIIRIKGLPERKIGEKIAK